MVSSSALILSAFFCMSSISASTTVVEHRKHIRSIQAKDVWPKFIYQSVAFTRNPSVHSNLFYEFNHRKCRRKAASVVLTKCIFQYPLFCDELILK